MFHIYRCIVSGIYDENLEQRFTAFLKYLQAA